MHCDKIVTCTFSGNQLNGRVPKPSSVKSLESPRLVTPSAVDFNLIDRARTLFEVAFPAAKLPATWSHGNRTFSIQDYLGFMLLGLYVPTCDSLRGLCRASELEEFKRRYRCFTMDLSSISKAQAHVPEEMLLPIIAQLSDETRAQARQAVRQADHVDPQASCPDVAQLGKFALRVVDSTVFAALPKMTWALFGAGKARKDGKKTASVRFHVSFDPIALCPLACAVTSATVDEKKKWQDLRPDKSSAEDGDDPSVEIGDRNFGSSHQTLHDLTEEGVNFVVRIKQATHLEILEEIAVSDEEKAAGIERHAWVSMGKSKKNRHHHRVRIIWLKRPGKVILLATNLAVEDAEAWVVAEMYRQRWQIELFFWWLKKIVKVGHWFARSEKGVRIQLYLVIILTLLIQLQTGRRPTKRMIELLHFYAQGMVSETELIVGLKARAREADLARESSRKRYLANKQAIQK
jgi:Transposase DDE domain